jgi:hypothetical protein
MINNTKWTNVPKRKLHRHNEKERPTAVSSEHGLSIILGDSRDSRTKSQIREVESRKTTRDVRTQCFETPEILFLTPNSTAAKV